MRNVNERGPSAMAGYGIVLAGAVGFVVACFLPFFDPFGQLPSLSIWKIQTIPPSAAETVGAVMVLFTGPAALGWIAIFGIARPRAWTIAALISASVVWALMSIGTLIAFYARFQTQADVGFWLMLVCTGAVLIGATVAFMSTRGTPLGFSGPPQAPHDADSLSDGTEETTTTEATA
jgi:hypothetical protein